MEDLTPRDGSDFNDSGARTNDLRQTGCSGMNSSESASESAPTRLGFPDGFVWGSATSSFQVEGGAGRDGKGLTNWDIYCGQQGNIRDGSNGDVACNHVELFESDVDLMVELGLSAYRFSIAWSRILPSGTGAVNPAGLDFYDRLVDKLVAAGITPLPTLYHWDLPYELEKNDGWVNRDTAYAFADYTEIVVRQLGDRVDTWTTLNEPFVSANHGYVTGEHAPGRTSWADGFAASHHLMLGHGLAGERIRALAPEAELAIVLNFTPSEPATTSAADRAETGRVHDLENRWYIEPLVGNGYPQATGDFYEWRQEEVHEGDLDLISAPIDLLGVNFYTRQFVSADGSFELPAGTRQNTMGWEIHPPSFGELLRWINDTYSFPKMLITENGTPMPDSVRDGDMIVDDDRIAYVSDHLAEVHGAIADGCPIIGYLVWSLFDNFEWAWGYGPKFGIVEVDFETLERRPKKSAYWFRDAAQANGFDRLPVD